MPMKKKKAKKPRKVQAEGAAPQPARNFPGSEFAPGNPGRGPAGAGKSSFVQRTKKATGRGS